MYDHKFANKLIQCILVFSSTRCVGQFYQDQKIAVLFTFLPFLNAKISRGQTKIAFLQWLHQYASHVKDKSGLMHKLKKYFLKIQGKYENRVDMGEAASNL